MSTWLSACVADVRTRLTPEDEGSLWVLFLDHRGEVPMGIAFGEALAQLDAEMTDNLRRLITAVAAYAVLLVVPRTNGRPRKTDRMLLQRLDAARCLKIELIDLLVVGRDRYWSARHEAAYSERDL